MDLTIHTVSLSLSRQERQGNRKKQEGREEWEGREERKSVGLRFKEWGNQQMPMHANCRARHFSKIPAKTCRNAIVGNKYCGKTYVKLPLDNIYGISTSGGIRFFFACLRTQVPKSCPPAILDVCHWVALLSWTRRSSDGERSSSTNPQRVSSGASEIRKIPGLSWACEIRTHTLAELLLFSVDIRGT